MEPKLTLSRIDKLSLTSSSSNNTTSLKTPLSSVISLNPKDYKNPTSSTILQSPIPTSPVTYAFDRDLSPLRVPKRKKVSAKEYNNAINQVLGSKLTYLRGKCLKLESKNSTLKRKLNAKTEQLKALIKQA